MILRNKHEILVRTVDSDVIIILLGFFPRFLHYNEHVNLSVDYGKGNFRRVINNCYQHIGENNALAIQFFRALSGYDSTSFIYKKVKLYFSINGCIHQNTKTSQKHFRN